MADSITRAGAQARNKAFGPGAFPRYPGGAHGGFYKNYQGQNIEHNEPRNLPGYKAFPHQPVYRGGARARPLPSPRSHPYPNSLKGPERV